MTDHIALLTLLHLLVFVYWLGGDLGAYYASRFISDPDRDLGARALAAKMLGDIDMAPRIGLLLTFPTGLAVAVSQGWWTLSWGWVILVFIVATLWIILAIAVHVMGAKAPSLQKADLSLRVIFLGGLLLLAVGGLSGQISIPYFICLKMLVLSFTILMGLMIRRMLVPFGPAFLTLMTHGASPELDQQLHSIINRARPFVWMIWLSLVLAAWLGLKTPT